MRFLKVAIVHFQPLEKYPPVMNLLIYLQQVTTIRIRIYSTKDKYYKKKLFGLKGANIYRIGSFYKTQSFILRYINYSVFNFFTFFRLLITKPSSIICYETLSIFPVYLYKKLFPATKIFIHYHEYAALNEISKSSLYIKWLNNLEKRIFSKASWISHTNEERLSMFKHDYKQMPFPNLEVLPNYPPSSWYNFKKRSKNKFEKPLKFVYVGALSLDSMYTKEFAAWIKELNGHATWDIYSGNYQENVLQYLEELNCPFINFKGEVEYFDLVKILNLYDVGVILYNGYIPNHIYSVPNKLFEYHACNLDVWFSQDIKGSLPYVTKGTYPKIIAIDFSALHAVDLSKAIEREGYSFHQGSFYYEDVLRSIKNKLLEID